MKLIKNTLLLVSSALLCASCSSYYSDHAGHPSAAARVQSKQSGRHQIAAQKARPMGAKTRAAQFSGQLAEQDNADRAWQTSEGFDDQAGKTAASDKQMPVNTANANSPSSNPKCLACKPTGGHEQHYFFGFDKSTVAQSDFMSVQAQSKYLLAHPNVKVRIEGNTDDRGSREYNVALAARRANAIIALLKQQGVPSKQFTMVSYGAEKPAAPGESKAAHHCNRRVDIIYEVH